MESANTQQKSRRGFAAMSSEKQREIAQKGGRVAHERGVAHKWNREEAAEAGRKGGLKKSKDRNEEGRP